MHCPMAEDNKGPPAPSQPGGVVQLLQDQAHDNVSAASGLTTAPSIFNTQVPGESSAHNSSGTSPLLQTNPDPNRNKLAAGN